MRPSLLVDLDAWMSETWATASPSSQSGKKRSKADRKQASAGPVSTRLSLRSCCNRWTNHQRQSEGKLHQPVLVLEGTFMLCLGVRGAGFWPGALPKGVQICVLMASL